MLAERLKTIETELVEIDNRMEWMQDNYSGCDWCCGGGDDEMADLNSRKTYLQAEKAKIELALATDMNSNDMF